jgi:hypothetical protein
MASKSKQSEEEKAAAKVAEEEQKVADEQKKLDAARVAEEEARVKAAEDNSNPSLGARGVDPQSDEGKALAKKEGSSKKVEGVTDFSKLKVDDDRYDPYQDPAVNSSVLADVINVERASGESPTLEACREAYKQRKV